LDVVGLEGCGKISRTSTPESSDAAAALLLLASALLAMETFFSDFRDILRVTGILMARQYEICIGRSQSK
jgi:hypothetical protein